MKQRLVILTVLLLLVSAILSADDINSKMSIGLHFGTVTGNGFAMRFMGESAGLQATLGAYTSGSNDVKFREYYYPEDGIVDPVITVERRGMDTSLNTALNGILFLDHFRKGRMYLIGGAAYTFYREKRFFSEYQRVPGSYGQYELRPNTETSEQNTEHRWTAGFGPGIEFAVSKHFHMSFEMPITYNYKDEIVMYIPQVGFYYYFK